MSPIGLTGLAKTQTSLQYILFNLLQHILYRVELILSTMSRWYNMVVGTEGSELSQNSCFLLPTPAQIRLVYFDENNIPVLTSKSYFREVQHGLGEFKKLKSL